MVRNWNLSVGTLKTCVKQTKFINKDCSKMLEHQVNLPQFYYHHFMKSMGQLFFFSLYSRSVWIIFSFRLNSKSLLAQPGNTGGEQMYKQTLKTSAALIGVGHKIFTNRSAKHNTRLEAGTPQLCFFPRFTYLKDKTHRRSQMATASNKAKHMQYSVGFCSLCRNIEK